MTTPFHACEGTKEASSHVDQLMTPAVIWSKGDKPKINLIADDGL